MFSQKLANGRWLVIDEFVTEDLRTVRFGELLGAKMAGEYQGFRFEVYGDPAGDARAQTDERTPFQILETLGIRASKAPSNDAALRREATASPMRRLELDGKPAFLISPKCHMTREGLAGRYYYKRVQVSGDERYQDKPYKNRYSHPVEALGYLLLGAGEGGKLIGMDMRKLQPVKKQKPLYSGHSWMAA